MDVPEFVRNVVKSRDRVFSKLAETGKLELVKYLNRG